MNIVRMAFLQGSSRNLHKTSVFLECLDILGSTITHTRANASDQLEYGIFYSTLVSHTPLDTLWDKLFRILLEVTVLTSVFHGSDGAHASVDFIFSSLEQFKSSRTLVTTCKNTSHHTYIGTSSDGLRHISRILDTTICNNRNAIFFRHSVAVHNRGNLRNTDTRYYTRSTDRSWPDTDFDRIYTSFDQSLCGFSRRHISGNDPQLRISLTNHPHHFKYVGGMTVCRINHHYIYFRLYQCVHTFHNICSHSHSGSTEKSSL